MSVQGTHALATQQSNVAMLANTCVSQNGNSATTSPMQVRGLDRQEDLLGHGHEQVHGTDDGARAQANFQHAEAEVVALDAAERDSLRRLHAALSVKVQNGSATVDEAQVLLEQLAHAATLRMQERHSALQALQQGAIQATQPRVPLLLSLIHI